MATKKQKVGSFISLRFPEDVGTEKVPAYIRFTPQTVIYGGTEGLNPVGKPSLSYGTGVTNNVSGGVLEQIKRQISGPGGVVDSFSKAATDAIKSVSGIFGSGATFSSTVGQLSKIVSGSVKIGDFTVALGQKTKPDQLRTEGSINLYLPEGLVTTSSVAYGNIEGAAIAAGVEAANGDLSLDSLKKVAGGAVTDMVRSSGMLNGILAQTTGKVMNNFSFQIFNGVNHRNFEYTFLLTPKNEKEAEEVKRICDTFLFLMLPGRSSEGSVQFYEIPCQWKIEYQYMGNRLEHFQQPNACFLQNVAVQYNSATGATLHTDGSPLQSTLSLSFIEIEPIYRKGDLLDEDIEK